MERTYSLPCTFARVLIVTFLAVFATLFFRAPLSFGGGGATEICNNHIDDDNDSLVDCNDGDCITDPACGEVCNNGVDDDADSLVDCNDGECIAFPGC